MFLSMNWIQDFVDLSGLDKIELIRKFSLSTAEVENDILRKGSEISGIVVGEIKSVENHPDSKKLHLLKIDAGEDELIDVVCGAPNVKVGLYRLQSALVGVLEERWPKSHSTLSRRSPRGSTSRSVPSSRATENER